jgi:phenylpropionate dioxygenase-like ring-hydroxylating dioxygenase large terminal subunit
VTEASTYHRTTASYRRGARTMPREVYVSTSVLADEQEKIFARQWNCVGRASRVASAGEYLVREIAGESIIVVRGRDDALRAFFNVCRHRGTRLCSEQHGRFSETIQCPYHAWTYSTDGRLIGAPQMQEAADFDKADYPLHEASVAEWEGFVFVNIEERPAPFEEAFAPVLERFRRFDLPSLEIGHRIEYDVHANWKLVFQNYSECLHCPVIHPELASVLPYQSGANDLTEGPFLGGYMEIMPPNESATLSGRACGPRISAAIAGDEAQRAYYYSLMPNLLLSIHPDYVNFYLLTAIAPDRTRVESEWLFPQGGEGDDRRQDAIAFWDVTNRQDWDIVERSQLGVSSRRYTPGPYSPRESIPAAWDREYQRVMAR